MDFKGTPGPWAGGGDGWPVVSGPDNKKVAACNGPKPTWCRPDAEALANTVLIAAAPDLLAALRTLVEDLRLHAHGQRAPGHVQHIRDAHAAIGRATGGATTGDRT